MRQHGTFSLWATVSQYFSLNFMNQVKTLIIIIHLFFHLFKKYLKNICSVPSIVRYVGDIKVKKWSNAPGEGII
jgi:hypothetical protein